MKLTKTMWTEEKEKEAIEDFRNFHEIYFSENPTHSPYISFSENGDSYICRLYIGVEDENGNATGSGIDEHITNGVGELFEHWENFFNTNGGKNEI